MRTLQEFVSQLQKFRLWSCTKKENNQNLYAERHFCQRQLLSRRHLFPHHPCLHHSTYSSHPTDVGMLSNLQHPFCGTDITTLDSSESLCCWERLKPSPGTLPDTLGSTSRAQPVLCRLNMFNSGMSKLSLRAQCRAFPATHLAGLLT